MKSLNIYLRIDGRWEGRIAKGKNRQGKRQYHAFFRKTKEDVIRKMDEFRKNTMVPCTVSITVSHLFQEWFQFVQQRVKKSTAANYVLKANKHILPAFGSCRISDITTDSIYGFICEKQKNGLSGRYISDILILMKSVFRYASIHYHAPNPMSSIVMPKKQKPDIRLLDTEEQKQLEQYIAENRNLTTLGIALTKATGLRIGELCALQWEDIDLKKRILTVRKTIQRIQCRGEKKKTKLIITDPKSESSKRCISIPKFLIEFLRDFQSDSKYFVLSGKETPIEPRTMQYRFSKILKNGKLPSVHFHALRHMFASNCVKMVFDVKML